jgi:hypothetical protein
MCPNFKLSVLEHFPFFFIMAKKCFIGFIVVGFIAKKKKKKRIDF